MPEAISYDECHFLITGEIIMTTSISKPDVNTFLEDYANALSKGDVKAIVAAWHTPSLVVSPEGVIAVSKSDEVEKFFKVSIADYNKKGISGAKLHAADITKISKSVATASVTWSHTKPDGQPGGEEYAFYVLSKSGVAGKLGIDLYSPANGV